MKIKGYTPQTEEAARGWLLEEMGEVAQAIGKDMRFPGGRHSAAGPNQIVIFEEIIDLYAALKAYAKFMRSHPPQP